MFAMEPHLRYCDGRNDAFILPASCRILWTDRNSSVNNIVFHREKICLGGFPGIREKFPSFPRAIRMVSNSNSLGEISETSMPNSRVEIQPNARDAWLDAVLLHRGGKQKNNLRNDSTLSSIFDTAMMVSDFFLSPDADSIGMKNDYLQSSRVIMTPPLRRVYCTGIDDCDLDENSWTREMFSPLFGVMDNRSDEVHLLPPAHKRETNKRKMLKRRRLNLKLTVTYIGLDFCGWEDQRHDLYRKNCEKLSISQEYDGPSSTAFNGVSKSEALPSVQGTLVDILDPVLGIPPNNKANINTRKKKTNCNGKRIEIQVAGRTDAGVSAISQVCRIRTWRTDFGHFIASDSGASTDDNGEFTDECVESFIKNLVNKEVGKFQLHGGGRRLRVRNVECMGDDFHPTFGATCRAYAYLIDLEDSDEGQPNYHAAAPSLTGLKISSHLVSKLDKLLRALEGRELDYIALSYGKIKTQTTLCTLFRARAGIVKWTKDEQTEAPSRQAVCIELVGDRFLRRMVRILVATALREATGFDAHGNYKSFDDGSDCQNGLLDILLTKDRQFRARAAPPDGLIFVGAGYE
mmetsp:Transcript_485/g.834  ORF Transcript_485/g.834 Transcript_485/m.834 type:complete len:576 (+) Transcript_485:306-2033(+)